MPACMFSSRFCRATSAALRLGGEAGTANHGWGETRESVTSSARSVSAVNVIARSSGASEASGATGWPSRKKSTRRGI